TGANAGDYSQTNNCPATLAHGASCTINVVFSPTATGTRVATLSVADDAGASPQTVSLTGVGTQNGPVVMLSPTSLTFATRALGNKSAPMVITMTNVGTSTLTGISIGITGANINDFSQTNTCAATLTAGSNCTISVSFIPQAAGTRSASVSI